MDTDGMASKTSWPKLNSGLEWVGPQSKAKAANMCSENLHDETNPFGFSWSCLRQCPKSGYWRNFISILKTNIPF